MMLTTHALIGATIGKHVSSPWIIALIAIPLHYIIDMFRHGEYVETMDSKTSVKNTWWKILLDFSGAIIIPFSIAKTQHFSLATTESMFIGIFFSIVPDFVTLLYWKFKGDFLQKIYLFHAWCHRFPRGAQEREWNLRNSLNDIILSVIAIVILFI